MLDSNAVITNHLRNVDGKSNRWDFMKRKLIYPIGICKTDRTRYHMISYETSA